MAGSMAEAMKKVGLIPKNHAEQIIAEKKAEVRREIKEAHSKLEAIEKLKAPMGVCPHCNQAVKTYKDKETGRSLLTFHSFKGTTCEGSEQEPEKMV